MDSINNLIAEWYAKVQAFGIKQLKTNSDSAFTVAAQYSIDTLSALIRARDREIGELFIKAFNNNAAPHNESQDQMYRRLEQVFDSVLRDLG